MLALSSFSEVNPMPYISKEQLATAREMDLLTYLQRYDPNELVHFSGNTYTTRTHDSLKISNRKWCWWSRGIGGSTALDYLTTSTWKLRDSTASCCPTCRQWMLWLPWAVMCNAPSCPANGGRTGDWTTRQDSRTRCF